MPDDIAASAPAPVEERSSGRSDRLPLLAIVADAETESVLREALVEAVPGGIIVRRGDIRLAIATMQKMPTPRTLIVDVSGEEHPLVMLGDLSSVVEPDVRVFVVGDQANVNFYRQVTRGLGALEYLYKPLTRDMVARHFLPLITRQAHTPQGMHGGRVVTVTGARGGVGATTIAAHLSWHFGVSARRHTLLLDPDLHMGTAALLLDAKTSPGLRTALEAPQRIDELFVERAAQPVSGRLHVLAGEERLTEQPAYAPGAAHQLVEALRRAYNFVVVDVPFAPMALNRDLLDLAHQRVLVTHPTLPGVRDTLRLLALPNGPMQPRRAVVILNRLGMTGGLTRNQMEEALKMKVDAVIPDQPRQLGAAANLGQPALAMRGAFRGAIIELAKELASLGVSDVPADAEFSPPTGWRHRLHLFAGRT